MHKAPLLYTRYGGCVKGKNITAWVPSWTSHFFPGTPLFTDKLLIQTWVLDTHFLKTEQRRLVTVISLEVFLPMKKFQLLSKKNLWFWRTFIYHCELDSLPILKTFLMSLTVILMWFLILYNEVCATISKICINQCNQNFPNDQCMMLQTRHV